MDRDDYEAKIADLLSKAAKELDLMDYHSLLSNTEVECETRREALESEHHIV